MKIKEKLEFAGIVLAVALGGYCLAWAYEQDDVHNTNMARIAAQQEKAAAENYHNIYCSFKIEGKPYHTKGYAFDWVTTGVRDEFTFCYWPKKDSDCDHVVITGEHFCHGVKESK